MSSIETPNYLKDASALLNDDGFSVGATWYHGTASGLLPSIQEKGLKRSGDAESNQSIKQTMATIGNSYTESIQPVFLTQSKELAFYWASQKAQFRTLRLGDEETPVVLEVALPENLSDQIKADAGGAALIIARDAYIEYLESVYEEHGKSLGELDPMSLRGEVCLAKLGLAYTNKDIATEYVTVVGQG